MKKRLLISLLFFITIYIHGFSQTVQEGQIKVYDSYQPTKGASFGQKNKISINPLGVLIGDYPLYYERMFGNTFSVEVAVGVTYQNYMRSLLDFGSSNYNSSDMEKSYKLGSTYSISPKVYLNDDNFEGSYLALCYRHRLYNAEATAYQGVPLNTPMKEYYKLNAFTFNYGYVFHLGKGFLLDYYLGVGLSGNTTSEITVNYTNSNFYPYVSKTYFTTTETKKTTPTGMMGLKISYAF